MSTKPGTLHYVGGNPLNLTDLSGECFIVCLSTVQSALKSAVSATDNFIQAHSTAIGWVETGSFVIGTVASVATTASSCYHQQWGGCAVGVASLGLTAGGWAVGNVANSFVFDAKQASGLLGKAGNYFMAGFSKSMPFMFNIGSVTFSGGGTALGDRVNHLSAAQCQQLH